MENEKPKSPTSETVKAQRLRHPREGKPRRKPPVRASKSSPWGMVFGVAGVLIGIALGVLIYQAGLREKELTDQVSELTEALFSVENQLNEYTNQLETDVELLQQRLGLTQAEIARARRFAEGIQQEQKQDVETLVTQIETKADADELNSLENNSNTRFTKIDSDIEGVRSDVMEGQKQISQTREEFKAELSSLGLQVTEQGKLIATNASGVDELIKRGERDIITFDLERRKRQNIAGIALELRGADQKRHRANLRLFYDDRRIDRRNVFANTPLVFYVGQDRIQYELVINEVRRNQITGYISVPAGKLPGKPALTRSGD